LLFSYLKFFNFYISFSVVFFTFVFSEICHITEFLTFIIF